MSELGFFPIAASDPDHLALVSPDGQRLTAGELAGRANALVHGLRALGLQRGDCIAVVLPNGAAVIELYLAVMQGGWYLTPINHHLTAPEIAYIVGDCDAKVFVGAASFGDACRAAMEELNFPADKRFALGNIPGFRPYSDISKGQPVTPPDDRRAGQVMNYTSGTTGKPKGVRRTLPEADPDMVGAMFAMFLAMFGISPRDNNVHLVGSPLYHTAVLMFAGSSLNFGHTVILMDKWTPEDCLQAIETHGVTTSHMVPTQFHRLLALPESVRNKYAHKTLRHMIHAAAPCPVEVKRRMMDWWGPVIYEYYAASEGGGTLVTPDEWLKYPGTVGRAWPSAEIRILDDANKDCPANQTGTVYMALGAASFEYHKDKAKTDANRRDGFFTVGDVGYLNDEGYLFLCDRKTDMIISGGVNIYPAEVESVLLTHPKVADAAVFGVPHEDWGEEVKAVIQLAPNVEQSQQVTDEILGFCRERVAKYKCPRTIDYVGDMPRDPNGKLYKRKLRDPYWQGRSRAI